MCVRMHIYAYSPRVDRARDGQKVIQRRSADGRAKGSIHPSYFIPADTIRGACIRGGYQITRVVCIHRISIYYELIGRLNENRI